MFLDYFNFLHFALGNVHLSFTVQTSTAEGLEEEKVAEIHIYLNKYRIAFASKPIQTKYRVIEKRFLTQYGDLEAQSYIFFIVILCITYAKFVYSILVKYIFVNPYGNSNDPVW